MSSAREDAKLSQLGVDRAELGERPDDRHAHSDPSKHCQVSIRHTIRKALPSLLAHPKDGVRRVRSMVDEKTADTTDEQYAPVLAPEPPNATGNERLEHDLEPRRKFPPAKEFVHHPISALKTVARDQGGDDFAANVMKSEVSHGESVKLLRQEDKLLDAQPETLEAEEQKFSQIKSARQDAFVRWSIDRHLRKAGVLRDVVHAPEAPADGASWREWMRYNRGCLLHRLEQAGRQHVVVTPAEKDAPTQGLLMSSIERVVVVSASFQSFVMGLRSISHWDNPRLSATCMVLYFVCLFFSQLTRSAILLVLLHVVYRRWKPPSVSDLREAVKHAEDHNQAVKTLTELTLQYGTRGWVDHLIDHAGPRLLHWSERMADLLERIQNFYEWRDPVRTRALLYKLFGLWLLITFTPTWLLVQMSFLMIGVSFFVLEPIAHHYPKYQLLTSPVMWMMWGIPTHTDWAITRLQAEAVAHVQAGSNDVNQTHTSTVNEADTLMIGRYSCSGGILKVTTLSASYKSGSPEEDSWRFSFENLITMQKVEQTTRTRQIQGLAFATENGDHYTAWDLDLRDEIFSQVLGYSRLHWKKIE